MLLIQATEQYRDWQFWLHHSRPEKAPEQTKLFEATNVSLFTLARQQEDTAERRTKDSGRGPRAGASTYPPFVSVQPELTVPAGHLASLLGLVLLIERDHGPIAVWHGVSALIAVGIASSRR
jgi:hypothetical protein